MSRWVLTLVLTTKILLWSSPAFSAAMDRPPFAILQQNQRWSNFLFAHWQIDADELREAVPPELEIDLWDGKAYVSIVSFEMTKGTLNALPIPVFSAFPQVNVRTYVRYKGQPGIYFLSIDADNRIVPRLGRFLFYLPYRSSTLSLTQRYGMFTMHLSHNERSQTFQAKYKPKGKAFFARDEGIDAFLTSRFRLFVVADGVVWKTEIRHAPWLLRHAKVQIAGNSMMSHLGVSLKRAPDLAHFVKEMEVALWPLVVAKDS